jgi:hypothetical protein
VEDRRTPKPLPDVRLNLGDKLLFGNDAGEDEDSEVLASYFLNQSAFDDFLNRDERLYVARGRKGIGKSALLSKLAHDLRQDESKPIVVSLVPSNLEAMLPQPGTTNSTVLENYWKQVICRAINYEIAKTIGFAWKDDEISLVENSELAGFRGRNIFGALIGRLLGKVNLLGSIELQPKIPGIANNEQLLKRMQDEQSDMRDVWVLIDDIDSKFQNTPEQQAYISSFFSACRGLAREISGISIRATVRTDVWTSLRAAEDLDKFEQYVTDISWNAKQQKEIITKRIHAYVMRKSPNSFVARNWDIYNHDDDLIELAFKRRIKWGASAVPAPQVLKILGAGRPRWMAQLCRLAGKKARDSGVDRIGPVEINEVMGPFGRLRLADLYKEHSHQFPDLQRLIESFSNGNRRFSTDQLTTKLMNDYVKIKGAKGIPAIDGDEFKDVLQLCHFLFKCGFFLAHNLADTSIENPEFISFEMRPDLLQVGTNLDDGMVWEIQPSYRTILRIK